VNHPHFGRRSVALLVLLALTLLGSGAARAAWTPPPGVDLTRPRVLFRAEDLGAIQSRLDGREPYRTVVAAMMQRVNQSNGVSLSDHSINAERIKARAAKNLAFFYAVDRTLVAGQVVPFPTEEARAAAGARVHDLLRNMYDRSRLAVPPPLGGWDRDISSSEELIQYATAFDTMLGAGWDFGEDEPLIADRIAALAGELYENYEDPDTAGGFSRLHQNNHRSKTGAAVATAAVALAEYTAAAGTDPNQVREPAIWIEFGLEQIDLVMRHALGTTDGAYGEGPFYFRYASENLIPFLRAWDRLLGGASFLARSVLVPSLWSHPLGEQSRRWVLDMTLPDGSLAPIDDGNPGRSYYFGAQPPESPLAPAFAWRWANAPARYETDGNVDLGADSIVLHDDAIAAAPPEGSPTAFYFDGGNAIFRSDWSPTATVAMVSGERDVASEFGRDRDGLGVAPQSHEHAEPGAFLLHAHGEMLALDPGYLSFTERPLVAKPEHHSMILVDGQGPVDYLFASLAWLNDLAGPPPIDGQATLSDAVDGDFLDAVRVTTSYGPAARAAAIERRFLFADDAYLAIADHVVRPSAPQDPPTAWTWLVHGNGGETSGGTFAPLASGGRWTRGAARLDAAISIDAGPPIVESGPSNHEGPNRTLLQHTVLRAYASGAERRSALLLYPTASDAPAPTIGDLGASGSAGLTLTDADRHVLFAHRAPGPGAIETAEGTAGLHAASSDGRLLLVDGHAGGSLRLAWTEGASELRYDGMLLLQSAQRGSLGLRRSPGRAEVVVDDGEPGTSVHALDFVPLAADGACSLTADGAGTASVTLSRERRFVLRASGGNSAPAADPGPERFVRPGEVVTLDASGSCDRDGDALDAHWEMIAAPPESDWVVENAEGLTPAFVASAPGTYRLRLVVTDAQGAASRPMEVAVHAVPLEDDADGDLVPDASDNCAAVPNLDQTDAEPFGGNGVGDACECTDGGCLDGARRPRAGSCTTRLRPLGEVEVADGQIRCADGAACDLSPRPGVCAIDALLCFGDFGREDACDAFPVARLRLSRLGDAASREAVIEELADLPGASVVSSREVRFDPELTEARCTAPIRLEFAAPHRHLQTLSTGASRTQNDRDRLRLVCER
jgi:hypothetical protein